MLALLLTLSLAAEPSFEQIAGSVREGHQVEAIAQMQSWVDAHPSDPNAGRGLVWISQLWLTEGKPERAVVLLERAVRDYPGTEWESAAQLKLADLAVRSHRYGVALPLYEKLAVSPLEYYAYLGKTGAEHTRDERSRFWLLLALSGGLVMVFAVRLRLGGLWPLPEEVYYAFPIAVMMGLAALAQPEDEARAVGTLAACGVALVWANATYFRRSPPGRWGYLREGLFALVQAAAVLYCAIVANGLWGKFADTLVSGAE